MLRFDHTNHKRLWNWLANNPNCIKADWPEWNFNGGNTDDVDYLCFACHASPNPQKGKWSGCYWSCPLIWDGDDCCGRFYYLWRSLCSLVEWRIQLASATPSKLNEKARWYSPLASPSNQRLRGVWAMHTLPGKNGTTSARQ